MINTSSPVPRSRGLAMRGAKVLNRLTLPLSGTRWFGIWAVLHHQGRRSGQAYATPVAARRTDRGFVIALPFGPEVDWLRNIQAAGECVIGWKGRDYREVDPQVVGWEQAKAAFNPAQRVVLRIARMKACVQLRDATPSR